MLYAKGVVQPEGFELLFAIVYPDGRWAVTQQLDPHSTRISFTEMIECVRGVDVVIPHLFCQQGLTTLRIFFEEVLQLPLVGSSGYVLHTAQNKYLTKLIAKAHGLSVPKSHLVYSVRLDPSVLLSFGWPKIVKPNTTDNSEGLALVNNTIELEEAILKALSFDREVLLEEYIPGPEIRGAILERESGYHALPFIEYKVSEESPIRHKADKLQFGAGGELIAQSDKRNVPAQCPANLEDKLLIKLTQAMTTLHIGLQCRDFSMYDFRVHEATGEPYLLEAGLFWSFSKTSMISTMLHADGIDLGSTTRALWLQAMDR